MFDFIYLSSNVLLIVLNLLLIRKMHFENIAWPIIAIAIPASAYLAAIDFALYYDWYSWFEEEYLFSSRILIYKVMIVMGLILSLIRLPIVRLEIRSRSRTDIERLAGRDDA
jgi:hypothetical protein